MNKILVLIITILLCFVFIACSKDPKTNVNLTKNNDTDIETTIEKASELLNVNLSLTAEDHGGADILPRKYREKFYSIPRSFVNIVGEKKYSKWEDKYLSDNYPDDTKEMVMVAYVKAFNISREEFDRANIKYAKFIDEIYSDNGTKTVICLDPQDYADQEFQEIFNADIIYTFDNEIISEYYLGIDYPFLNEYQYVEALEAGTYQTRTTEFITVEQMIADYEEKYGVKYESPESTTAVSVAEVTEETTETTTEALTSIE